MGPEDILSLLWWMHLHCCRNNAELSSIRFLLFPDKWVDHALADTKVNSASNFCTCICCHAVYWIRSVSASRLTRQAHFPPQHCRQHIWKGQIGLWKEWLIVGLIEEHGQLDGGMKVTWDKMKHFMIKNVTADLIQVLHCRVHLPTRPVPPQISKGGNFTINLVAHSHFSNDTLTVEERVLHTK